MNLHLHMGQAVGRRRIGLLGGSFNPAHDGHRAMSLHALRRLGLDEVWWLVSPQNPLKSAATMLLLTDRMVFAQQVAHHPRIKVTDIETQMGTRYTIDSLRGLKRRFPHARFVWLMGADNLRQIPKWREWVGIFNTVPVAVFRRPAYAVGRNSGQAAQRFDKAWQRTAGMAAKNFAQHTAPAWTILDNQLNTHSATKIREDKTTWQKLLKQRKPSRKSPKPPK